MLKQVKKICRERLGINPDDDFSTTSWTNKTKLVMY